MSIKFLLNKTIYILYIYDYVKTKWWCVFSLFRGHLFIDLHLRFHDFTRTYVVCLISSTLIPSQTISFFTWIIVVKIKRKDAQDIYFQICYYMMSASERLVNMFIFIWEHIMWKSELNKCSAKPFICTNLRFHVFFWKTVLSNIWGYAYFSRI